MSGNDTISGQGAVAGVTAPVPYPLPLDLKGGDGGDTLTGGNYADTLTGGLGADIEAGGDNTDTFIEDATVNGNDSFSGGNGSDDKLDYSARTASLNVSLDGIANDGQPGLELDNVQPDIEFYVLGSGDDTFTGPGPGFAQMRISMGAGTDTINDMDRRPTASTAAPATTPSTGASGRLDLRRYGRRPHGRRRGLRRVLRGR